MFNSPYFYSRSNNGGAYSANGYNGGGSNSVIGQATGAGGFGLYQEDYSKFDIYDYPLSVDGGQDMFEDNASVYSMFTSNSHMGGQHRMVPQPIPRGCATPPNNYYCRSDMKLAHHHSETYPLSTSFTHDTSDIHIYKKFYQQNHDDDLSQFSKNSLFCFNPNEGATTTGGGGHEDLGSQDDLDDFNQRAEDTDDEDAHRLS